MENTVQMMFPEAGPAAMDVWDGAVELARLGAGNPELAHLQARAHREAARFCKMIHADWLGEDGDILIWILCLESEAAADAAFETLADGAWS